MFDVGPGIQNKMDDLGDIPTRSSQWFKGTDGETYSEWGYGLNYDYRATRITGEWIVKAYPLFTDIPDTGIEYQIEWYGSPNFHQGRAGHKATAIVLHTMVGTLSGTDGWFNNPNSQVSSHYGVGLQAQIHQYVSEFNSAWGNGVKTSNNRWPYNDSVNPNYRSISIETEDNGDPTLLVPHEQYDAVLWLCKKVIEKHPIEYLVAHRAIDTGRSCPGTRWVESGLMTKLANSLDLKLIV